MSLQIKTIRPSNLLVSIGEYKPGQSKIKQLFNKIQKLI